jgi:DNA-binding response OmpR family regulator
MTMKKGDRSRRRRKVLVVAYDPEIIQILKVNLAHAKFDVITAQSGTEALVKASTEEPDLVLLDTALPDMAATEVNRRLKDSPQTAHVPVIVIDNEEEDNERT